MATSSTEPPPETERSDPSALYISMEGEEEHETHRPGIIGTYEGRYRDWSLPFLQSWFGFSSSESNESNDVDGSPQQEILEADDSAENELQEAPRGGALLFPVAFSLNCIALPLFYVCAGMSVVLSRQYMTLLSEVFTVAVEFSGATWVAPSATLRYLFLVGSVVPTWYRPLLALCSDVHPFASVGERRKPYLYVGALIYVLGNLFSALSAAFQFDTGLIVAGGIYGIGITLMTVVADAMVVENTFRTNTVADRGRFLVACVLAYSLGGMIGNVLKWIVSIVWLPPIINLLVICMVFAPFLPHLKDVSVDKNQISFRSITSTVWHTLQRTTVLMPMIFILVVATISKACKLLYAQTWSYPLFMGKNLATAQDSAYWFWAIGALLFARFFFHQSWRKTVPMSVVMVVIIMLSNLAIPSSLYTTYIALFLTNIAEMFGQLPIQIAIVALCPVGAEATVHVLLQFWRTSLANTLARGLSGILTARIFHGSTIWITITLAIMLLVATLGLLQLFPESVAHQIENQKSDSSRRMWVFVTTWIVLGTCFLALTFFPWIAYEQ